MRTVALSSVVFAWPRELVFSTVSILFGRWPIGTRAESPSPSDGSSVFNLQHLTKEKTQVFYPTHEAIARKVRIIQQEPFLGYTWLRSQEDCGGVDLQTPDPVFELGVRLRKSEERGRPSDSEPLHSHHPIIRERKE